MMQGFKKADRPGTPLALLMMVLAVCAGQVFFLYDDDDRHRRVGQLGGMGF